MKSIYNPPYSFLPAIVLHIIGAILWVSGINWGIWTIILTQRESPFYSVFEGSKGDSFDFYGDPSDFTPLLAIAIIFCILLGLGFHLLGAVIAKNTIIELIAQDKASKQTENKELQELKERLAQVEQNLDQPNTS